jgi:hypothetical protein
MLWVKFLGTAAPNCPETGSISLVTNVLKGAVADQVGIPGSAVDTETTGTSLAV